MSTAVAKFVSKVSKHFPPSKFESDAEETEWLASIIESLKAYDDDILARAAQRIIDTRGIRQGEKWFPVPAEIRKVCAEIVAFDKARALPLEATQTSQRRSHRFEIARELINGAMGREAARDGWAEALHEFCVREGRLPDGTKSVGYSDLITDTEGRAHRGTDGRLATHMVIETEVQHLKRSAREAYELLEHVHRSPGIWNRGLLIRMGEAFQARERERAAEILSSERSVR